MKVPWDEMGMQSYPEGRYTRESGYTDPEFRDLNLDGVLEFYRITKGRSAVTFWFKDKQGFQYPMFLTDFEAAVKYMSAGTLEGIFKVRKQGQNYGLCYIGRI